MEKTITINPDHLKYSASTSSKKKRKIPKKTARTRIRTDHKINTLKKALMKKIQKHQERQRLKIRQDSESPLKQRRKAPKPIIQSKPQQEPKPSFAYLENLQKEYQERQNKPKSHPQPRPNIKSNVSQVLNQKPKYSHRIIADIPSEPSTTSNPKTPVFQLKDPPVYGILKGGNKPLYSNYRKTLKQQEKLKSQKERSPRHTTMVNHTPLMIKETQPSQSIIDPIQTIRQSKLEKVKKLFKQPREKGEKREKPISKKPSTFSPFSQTHKIRNGSRVRRTIKRRYQVGKIKTHHSNQVHVLVKNRKTRKKDAMEYSGLKKVPLIDVKKYLRERNLIRVGSQAPEYILRELYESSKISGDVENKSTDVLYHNFVNTDGETDGDLQPVFTSMNYEAGDLLKQLDNKPLDNTAPGDTSALDAMLTTKH